MGNSIAVSTSPADVLAAKTNQLRESGNAAQDPAKMKKAARDFEAVLLTQWLGAAEKSFGTVPGSGDDQQDPGHDQIQGLGVQHIATAIANAGGIGIGAMLTRYLQTTNTTQESDTKKP
jgi:Rod binding domain-containing protein